MPDPKMFIVWSSKYKYIAEQIRDILLEKRKDGFPLYPVMFDTGNDLHVNKELHSSLIEKMDKSDFALILLTPDDEVLYRKPGQAMAGFYLTSRPNVYFEYGYLFNRLHTDRIFVYSSSNLSLASDITSLIYNNINISSDIDNILRLPNQIVESIVNYFKQNEHKYFINMDQLHYAMDYNSIFYNELHKQNEYAMNSSLKLGNFWRDELKEFPEDPYQIERKLIYILERIPFNVYLYSTHHSTKFNDKYKNFLDAQVILDISEDINMYLHKITNPKLYEKYVLYRSNLKMIQAIERYQSKRNDSEAFRLQGEDSFDEEVSALLSVEKMLNKFPISQMLFNRYLAIGLHKKVCTKLNVSNNDIGIIKKIKYDENNIDFWECILMLLLALDYIQVTIDIAKDCDKESGASLHECLALFDKAKIEYLLNNLLTLVSEQKDLRDNELIEYCSSMISSHFHEMSSIKEYIRKRFKTQVINSVNEALEELFVELRKYSEVPTNFTIKLMDNISYEICNEMFKDLGNQLDDKWDNINKASESAKEAKEAIEGSEGRLDIKYNIFSIVSSERILCRKCSKGDKSFQNKVYKAIIDSVNYYQKSHKQNDLGFIIKELYLKKKINKDDSDRASEINKSKQENNAESSDSMLELGKRYVDNYGLEIECLKKKLIKNLNKQLENIGTKKWEGTMDKAIIRRSTLWDISKTWPPNMRAILLYETLHAKSEKYIYKIREFQQELNTNNNEIDVATEANSQVSSSLFQLDGVCIKSKCAMLSSIIDKFDKKNEKDDKKNEQGKEKKIKEYIHIVELLEDIRLELDYTRELLEVNHEIPDLYNNVLQKIENEREGINETLNKLLEKFDKNKKDEKKETDNC